MNFSKFISTAPGVTEANPQITPLILTNGIITGGFLWFPYGPAGNLHALVKMKGVQLLPANTGENWAADNCILPFSTIINLTEPSYQIDIVTWNDSGSFAHSLLMCFYLQER